MRIVPILGIVSTAYTAEEVKLPLQYKVGEGLYIGDDNNLVHIQGRFQSRFTFNGLEQAFDTNSFAVTRGEIRLDGFTLEKKLYYGFEMNLATRNQATTTANAITTESTSGLASLNDYYVDWIPTPTFGLQAGQFKVPFLMQQLVGAIKQQFIDRSMATDIFNFGRDIGLSIHGKILENRMNYEIFVMNGEGANSFNRNNKALLTGTRIEVSLVGEYNPSESDVAHSEQPNLGFGLAYAFNESGVTSQNSTIAAGTKAHHGTIDVGYKHRGLSFQGAGMLTRTVEGVRLTNWGYNGQIGYFFLPKVIEVASRTSGAIFSNGAVNQYEYALVLNYFIKGHGIKLQTDYAFLPNNRGQNLNDHRVRSALNFIF
ncbi:MAG: hypothetical protein HYT77_05440 [Deltaproteobacteria bacterium]|nr:hypothetical protein [Deltaproteobacteria bacterium]